MNRSAFLSFLFLCAATCTVRSQVEPCFPDAADIKRARVNYDKAFIHYSHKQPELAWKFVRIAEKIEPCYPEVHLLKAQLYEDAKNYDSAIVSYKRAFDINPECFVNGWFFLAQLEVKTGRYQDAEPHFERYLSYGSISDKMREQATMAQMRNRETLKIVGHTVPFNPVNLGPNVNTAEDEYLPVVTLDDSVLIFTRRYMKADPFPHPEEDFFVSYRDSNGAWTKSVPMPGLVNSPENEGSESISADGQYLFFAGCNRNDGMGSCDIYVCYKEAGGWGRPRNIGAPVNTMNWESQPCISSNGKTLYFVSNRPGGFGGSDIWKSDFVNGVWGRPENLGPSVNTDKDESSPYIHPDGHTLYFASNGHGGLGGVDLFVTRMDEKGRWSAPQNLGYPINTVNDEFALTVNAKGDKAYYTATRPDGFGGKDLYEFELYEQVRPEPVSFMKGVVKDAVTGKPLAAKFEVINLSTGKVRIESSAAEHSGQFMICLPCDQPYALNVSYPGYMFYSEHIALTAANMNKPKTNTILLQPVRQYSTVVLNNIFYPTNEFVLEESSMPELRKVFWFLKNNPGIIVEISGHTDNVGSPAYNKALSLRRAQAVATFLINSGIESGRIRPVGYGSEKPVGDNNTEAGRALNRRTEMKIL